MTVTIVGNALVKEHVGKTIDASDIVCRFNTFTLNGHEHLIGSRTTHWMVRKERTHQFDLFDTSELQVIYVMWDDPKYNEHLERQRCLIRPAQHIVRRAARRINRLYQGEETIHPTLGIAAIWFFLQKFGRVQIAGFGPPHLSYHGRMENAPHRWKYRRIGGMGHYWNFERRLINRMVDNGSVIRLENGVIDE